MGMEGYLLIKIITVSLIGYLIGSIPCSFIVSKLVGKIDIREHGSGNSGATNVFRTLGKKAGAMAFAGDFLKGVLATLVGLNFFSGNETLFCSGMAIIGHCYPIWTKFKGGKGVATSGGMIFTITPPVGLILLIIQFGTLFVTRIMSIASIVAAISYPIVILIMKYPTSYLYYSIFLGAFVVYRHKGNIIKLIRGQERKLL